MIERRLGTDWSEIEMVTQGALCDGKPVCAMVVAVYKSEGWE